MSDTDTHFEDALRQSLAASAETLEIPDGLASGGIRRARRRSARRAAAVGLPAVAAVAVLVAVFSGSLRTGGVSVADAKVIAKRVSAQATRVGVSGGVLETLSAGAGQRMQEWTYTNPRTGVEYDHTKYADAGGKYVYGYWNRASPLGHGRVKDLTLQIDPLRKTYQVQSGTSRAQPSGDVGVQSTARQIVHDLKHGPVSLGGRATLQGQKVLRLKMAASQGPGVRVLYVDAKTYRPVEEVIHLEPHGQAVIDRLRLLPATPGNIARAADKPDLPGYRHD